MNGKIYKLIDPRDNSIKYIGQTVQKLSTRYKSHIYDSLILNEKYKKCTWIRKLAKLNLLPIIELVEEIDKVDLNNRERYWIKYYKELGATLTNSTDGGNDMCIKIKKYRERVCNKPVFSFNRYTGETLTFDSTKEASVKTMTSLKNLTKAIHCKGECNGYYWKYTPFGATWVPPKRGNYRHTKLIDINGNVFNFKCITEAIIFTKGTHNRHKNGARSAIKYNKFYRGYYWKEMEGPLFNNDANSVNSGDLLNKDNPDLSIVNDKEVTMKEQRLTSEESTNNLDTSAEQLKITDSNKNYWINYEERKVLREFYGYKVDDIV